MLTVRNRRTIVVDFCRPRQANRKTPLAVVWVLGGMLAATSTNVVDLGKQRSSHHVGVAQLR